MPLALAEKNCTPCRGGVPPLTQGEATGFQAQAPDWDLRDDAKRIHPFLEQLEIHFHQLAGFPCARAGPFHRVPLQWHYFPCSGGL